MQRDFMKHTPKELNLENGDEIDVMVEQVGGSQ
jgi:hypothetical protein